MSDAIEYPKNRSGSTPEGTALRIIFRPKGGTYTWAIYAGPSSILVSEGLVASGPFNMCRFANVLFNKLCSGEMSLRPQTPHETGEVRA